MLDSGDGVDSDGGEEEESCKSITTSYNEGSSSMAFSAIKGRRW